MKNQNQLSLTTRICTLFFATAFCLNTNAQIIKTIAGNGTAGYVGDGGAATAAEIHTPWGMAIDAAGNLYVADYSNNAVRKISTLGIITTIAGNGTGAYGGDNGQATAALLNSPTDVAFDATGNLYIADAGNNRIRMINTSGIISTIVGTGTAGYSGDGGQATDAKLNFEMGVTVDVTGNLYIADRGNNVVRKVNSLGIITTVAGSGTSGFSGDGGQATVAKLSTPFNVATDAIGNLYIADYNNNRIRKVDNTGVITTFAGNGSSGFSGDGGQATAAAIGYPASIRVDGIGNLYMTDDYVGYRVRMLDGSGRINTVAGGGGPSFSGDGGQATAAGLQPYGIALDGAGNLYIADAGNNRIRFVCNAPITVTVSSATICPGTTATLTANGGTIYNWSTNETGTEINPSPTVTSTYTVTGSTGFCTAKATSTVTLYPNLLTVNNAVLCIGATTTLTANGATTYTWNTSETGSTITPSPTVTTNYTVTGTDLNNCVYTKTNTVTVNSLPVIIVNTATICAGSTATLTATGAQTYFWSNGLVVNPLSVMPALTTQYTVIGTDANNCTNTATAIVTVNALPDVNVVAQTTSGCVPVCTLLSNTGTTTGTYNWNLGDGNTSNSSGSIMNCYNPSGNYHVSLSVTDNNNCVDSSSITITVYPMPIANFSLTPQPANMSNPTIDFTDLTTGPSIQSWHWSFGDAANNTSNLQNPSFTYQAAGTYSVQLSITSINGCTDSIMQTIVISPSLGINYFSGDNSKISVYPNPTQGILNLELKTINTIQQNAILLITDVLGNVVNQSVIYNSTSTINVSDLQNGIYFINVKIDGKQYTQKVIKN